MRNIKQIVALGMLAGSIVAPVEASDEFTDRFEFSGFGRIVAGYLDESNASYNGYSNEISITEQSLFALQSDVTITDTLRLSAQLLAHSDDNRESGLEWFYLNYEPNQNWRFKLGKLRTPFFRYSDVIDVGFSYPWITPPLQVYNGFLFSNYEGVSATYRFNYSEKNFEIEAYYGSYDGEYVRGENKADIEVDQTKGILFSVDSGNLAMRFSVTEFSDLFAEVPAVNQLALALSRAGFADNAESLSFDGKARTYQASISYDTLDYFAAAEWTQIRSDVNLIPAVESYYLSLGYNFFPFQTHITYASSNNTNDFAANTVPVGIASQLDQLSYAYDQFTSSFSTYPLNSVTLGIRWDFQHNMALKADVSFLNGQKDQDSFFTDISDSSFDRQATLYQFGVEWFF